ncbi:MAG: hypothetical protein GYB65_21710, partial [Chloroflexi bacterium]|nr:hypothetical protein [Chloroflexota bacterium]
MRPRWFKLGLVLVLVVTAVFAALPGNTQAQIGGTISYGNSVFGALSATTQSLTYSFDGSADDLVTVEALGLTSGLDPMVTLLGPDGQTLATGGDDRYITGTSDVFFSLFLPATGSYALVLSSQNSSTGDFMLQLRGQPAGTTTPLAYDTPVTVPLSADAAFYQYHFDTDCPTTLTVDNQVFGPDFPYVVRVRNAQGELFALLRGPNKLEDRVMLPGQSGRYLVEVQLEDPLAMGSIALVITCAENAPDCVCDGAEMEPAAVVECPECRPCDEPVDAPPCAGAVFTAGLVAEGVRDVQIAYALVPEAAYGYLILSGQYVDGGEAYLTSLMLLDRTGEFAFEPLPGYYSALRLRMQHLDADDNVLCESEVLVELPPSDGEPVPWGPAVDCTVELVAPRETMANGLQTFFWSDVPGAHHYNLRVWRDGDMVANGTVSAPATSLTLDVSEASIGSGTEFTIAIEAFLDAGGANSCWDSVDVVRDTPAWGPAPGECRVELLAPLDTIANGIQTVFWSEVPGAHTYRVLVQDEAGSTVAQGSIGAPATSLTLDMSEGSIGPGTQFTI